jgi:hypothetical protein
MEAQLTLGTASMIAARYWRGAAVDNKEARRDSGSGEVVVRIVSPSHVERIET